MGDIEVYAVHSLDEAVRFLNHERAHLPAMRTESHYIQPRPAARRLDFSDVKGQHSLRRAVEIAVSGGHNLLMIGSPGSGKSMIAKRIPGIMPRPEIDEFLEILSIHSAAGITLDAENRIYERPYRSPHHTISDAGLLGGGIHRPGRNLTRAQWCALPR